MDGWMDGWVGGWVGGWTERRTDGLTDGWTLTTSGGKSAFPLPSRTGFGVKASSSR